MQEVSIIIPFHNVEDFIEECLESVRTQDYPSLQVILVDDASPDGSRAIAKAFCERDARFTLLSHERNLGIGPARNTGIEVATGDYLLFLDSDDRFSSDDAVSRLVVLAEETGSEVVAGSAQRLNQDGSFEPFDGRIESRRWDGSKSTLAGEEAYRAVVGSGPGYLPMRPWGYLIARRLGKHPELRFPKGTHEDMPYVPALCFCANKVEYSRDIFIDYRDRPAGLSQTPMTVEKLTEIEGVWEYTKQLNQRLGLAHHNGDSAANFLAHMVWRCVSNGFSAGDRGRVIASIKRQLGEMEDTTSPILLKRSITTLFWGFDKMEFSPEERLETMLCLPVDTFIKFHLDAGDRHEADCTHGITRPAAAGHSSGQGSASEDPRIAALMRIADNQSARTLSLERQVLGAQHSRDQAWSKVQQSKAEAQQSKAEVRSLVARLQNFHLVTPKGARKVANAPDDYRGRSWLSILLRHPMQISLWQAVRRLQGRSSMSSGHRETAQKATTKKTTT
ncbi:MAG: glycosyltransferase [Pseudomonadota bacterium]